MNHHVGIAAPASAQSAALSYVSDSEKGIVRRRAGRGFRYAGPEGRAVTEKETLARIRVLAIPPAWTDVWICPDPEGHLQATGRDERGRKQYRYHPRWTACRDDVKYAGLADFARALPDLRGRIDADLRRRGLPRERVLASVVWLLDNTMIRVGNAVYARDNKSFGLTTLRSRHLEVEGSQLRFAFTGKSGKEWKLRLVDRRISRVLKAIQELPGQSLFQYLDAEGHRRQIHSEDVNAYIRETGRADFSSKHFRTWGGTVRAMTGFAETPVPDTVSARRRTLNGIVDGVARQLGNTRAVCRKCYIHPALITAWEAGRLPDQLAALRTSRRKPPAGMDPEELLVLRWLDAHA